MKRSVAHALKLELIREILKYDLDHGFTFKSLYKKSQWVLLEIRSEVYIDWHEQ